MTAAGLVNQFDLLGPLPLGVTMVLEASAGTGKTHALSALATRYLADGCYRADQMLLVTFSRSATAELRARVYRRLLTSRHHLESWLATGTLPMDPIDQQLCSGQRAEVVQRCERLSRAIMDFDKAVVATTHEFCNRMLRELGVLVDHDSAEHFAADAETVLRQVGADSYLRTIDDPSQLWPSAVHALVPMLAQWPRAALEPTTEPLAPAIRFAEEFRAELPDRRRRLRSYGFDDMVTRLAQALDDPVTGPAAASRLASRFPLVMVDEFQDTDPMQWQVIRLAFHGRSTVILIGDPKQAIYFFRGADVTSYLQARGQADLRVNLGVNHRSDPGIVAGVQELFGTAGLGVDRGDIGMTPVTAAHSGSRLSGTAGAPIQLRRFPAEVTPAEADQWIRTDLVAQVAALLEPGAVHLVDRPGDLPRALRAQDIAVLVQARHRGELICAALRQAGIPSVSTDNLGIFDSPAADDWELLLTALVNPRPSTIAQAQLSSLIGWHPLQLATASDSEREGVTATLRTAARLLDDSGVAAVFELLAERTKLYARLLSSPGGDRMLTDLRHLSQLLHEAQRTRHLAGPQLLDWLADQRSATNPSQERTRRLETDQEAVQVLTVHRAKGLEFPIVILPDFCHGPIPPGRYQPLAYHRGDQMVLHLTSRNRRAAEKAAAAEDAAESLRRFYVATTRASSRLILYWAHTVRTANSPLHRLLCNDEPPGSPPAAGYEPNLPWPAERLSGDLFDVHKLAEPDQPPPPRARQGRPLLEPRRLTPGRIDFEWQRTSYSALTADIHGRSPGTDPSAQADLDEPEDPNAPTGSGEPGGLGALSSVPGDQAGLPATTHLPSAPPRMALNAPLQPSPMADLPGGTQFGTVVHAALEHVDFAAPDLPEALTRQCTRWLRRVPVSDLDPGSLADALGTVLDTPLTPLANGRRLRDFPAADRLAELRFELPLGTLDGSRRGTVAALARLFSDRNLVMANDPLADYGVRLLDSPAAETVLKGFLTGSLDAILRYPGEGRTHYLVIDYKTNRLSSPPGQTLSVEDYHAGAMAEAMMAAHYPLQALLYCVALDRFLSWRLPGYDPDTQFEGVGYLFIRGMGGPDTPELGGMTCGVFAWHPRPALISRASAILAGELP